MYETAQKQNRAELQEEFKQAKTIRDIKRELEKPGEDIPLTVIKIVVEEYLRLMSNQGSVDSRRAVVIDRSMVNPETPDDAA